MLWFPLLPLHAIPTERARQVTLPNGRRLCVIRTAAGQVAIFDDACPHQGLSLSGGKAYGDRFVCPWHAWEFQLANGVSPVNPDITVPTHPARINRRGIVCVGIPRPASDPARSADSPAE